MESKPETVLNPEEEFKRLREKTGQQELTELKRGLMGGYKKKDVAAYVERLKNQLATAERTYKARIAELSQEKDQLRYERDSLQSRLRQTESEPASDELKTALQQAQQVAESFLADRGSLEEKLKHMTRMSDDAVNSLQRRVEELETALAQAGERNEALIYEADAARLVLGGPFTAVFWVLVVGMGIILPLVIQSLAAAHRIRHTVVAPIFVLAGGLALRFVIVLAGQYSHWPRG
jgi:chromosome segregation ATPase